MVVVLKIILEIFPDPGDNDLHSVSHSMYQKRPTQCRNRRVVRLHNQGSGGDESDEEKRANKRSDYLTLLYPEPLNVQPSTGPLIKVNASQSALAEVISFNRDLRKDIGQCRQDSNQISLKHYRPLNLTPKFFPRHNSTLKTSINSRNDSVPDGPRKYL